MNGFKGKPAAALSVSRGLDREKTGLRFGGYVDEVYFSLLKVG